MTFHLPKDIQDKVQAIRDATGKSRAAFANLKDSDLAISAEFWMNHCEAPNRIKPDELVYDSTFWHAIVPEMIKRLREKY